MDYVLSEHAGNVMRERGVAPEWVAAAMATPDLVLPHEQDATLRYAFKRIPDFGNRVLRVVYNETVDPPVIVTVYFDRTMKGKL